MRHIPADATSPWTCHATSILRQAWAANGLTSDGESGVLADARRLGAGRVHPVRAVGDGDVSERILVLAAGVGGGLDRAVGADGGEDVLVHVEEHLAIGMIGAALA